MNSATQLDWKTLCSLSDLVPFSGVAAKLGNAQIALFYLPNQEDSLFAVCNHDPVSKANVIARGIIGDLNGDPVVASPLYKQHYVLKSGECLEDENVTVETWECRISNDQVELCLK